MFDLAVVKAFNNAVVRSENWDKNGIIWNFIDSDMYMEVKPASKAQEDQFYRMFDDLADMHEKQYADATYTDYMAYQAKVETEYKELFEVN